MIRSVRFRFTACAASGERSLSACLPVASTAQPDRSAPDNSAPLTGLFYGGGTQVLKAQTDRQRDRHAMHIRGCHGGDVRGERDRHAARVGRRRAYGLDLHEHGISAYPEYVISALGAPSGLSQHVPKADPKPVLAASSVPQTANG